MALDEVRKEGLKRMFFFVCQVFSISDDVFLERVNERDAFIRESWVRAMEARIVRENLEKCHSIEGVNHYEKCKHLADRYGEMLKENKVRLSYTPHVQLP